MTSSMIICRTKIALEAINKRMTVVHRCIRTPNR